MATRSKHHRARFIASGSGEDFTDTIKRVGINLMALAPLGDTTSFEALCIPPTLATVADDSEHPRIYTSGGLNALDLLLTQAQLNR